MENDILNKKMQKEWHVNHGHIGSKMFLADITRFSKYNRLVRYTAWVLRYLNNCLDKTGKRNGNDIELTAQEINDADKF